MKFDISVSIDLDTIQKRINDLAEEIEHPTGMLREMGQYMVASSKLNFEKQSDPFGKRWIPSQAALKEGRPTLIKTGDLQRSISYKSDDNEVRVGTDIFYGKFHQLGTSKMVQRKFLGAGPRDILALSAIVTKYFERLYKKHFP